MKVKREVLIISIQKGEGIGKMEGEGRFYEGGDDEPDLEDRQCWLRQGAACFYFGEEGSRCGGNWAEPTMRKTQLSEMFGEINI